MARLITFLILVFLTITLLESSIAGGGGMASTELTADLSATDTTAQVTKTNGFLSIDTIYIDGEAIPYNGTDSEHFNSLTRGDTATTHSAGAMVYTEGANAITQIFGFNPQSVKTASSNIFALAFTLIGGFFTVTLPHIVMLQISFITGDLWYLGLIFWAIGGGLLIALAIAFKPNIV